MSSLCLRPGIRFGPYPERTDERAPALDELLQRQIGAWVRWPGAVQRRARRFLDAVNAAEPALREADDAGLARVTGDIRRELTRGGLVDEVSARAFALVREQSRRTLNMRHHDCQVIGRFAMLQGMLAEMETGEGKTLAVTLPAATAALAGIPVHVITVNDYLVTRDAALMGPLYRALGLSVGSVTQQLADPRQRRAAYASDVTYCCNKQLVFDYLRDRVAMGARRGRLQRMLDAVATEQSRPAPLILRGLAFGIVDEADSVLIDECRTPLILSRPGKTLYAPEVYGQALQVAAGLQPEVHYAIDPKDRVVALTAAGRKGLAAAAPAGDACWSATRRREELVRQGPRGR